jgi:UDP-3-O-[3-hydroxymyristoyl] glucosamine N-acyltransferase
VGATLGDIAGRYGCELHGDPDTVVERVATLSGAAEDSITFLANPAYRSQLESTAAGCVILGPDDVESCPTAALVNRNPYIVYAQVAAELHPAASLSPGIDPGATVADGADIPASCEVAAGAVIADGVTLGERVSIGANAFIGTGSRIGDDSRLMSGVNVYSNVRIGCRCILHSGAVVGSDGFGFAPDETRAYIKVPQVGGVVIGDDVEIGANTAIDRGAIDDTVIGDGVKLDNLIQVAHNVSIGAHTAIAALVGISGSTTIGSRCVIGGHSGFAGHINVVDDVMIGAGTAIMNSIKKPGMYGGAPAIADEIGRWRKNVARYRQLDSMARRLYKLEKKIEKASDGD